MASSRKRSVRPSKKPAFVRRAPTPRGVGREAEKGGRPKRRKEPAASATVLSFEPQRYLERLVAEVPDFPEPGVLFRDITPLLADPKGFHIALDALAERFVGEHVDAIVAPESRGFIFGGALAARLNASFVPVRKPGKLPGRIDSVAYALEYGESVLEMHQGALDPGANVVVVDDLLATGGTAAAAAELIRRQQGNVLACAFVVELGQLKGRVHLAPIPVVSLIRYD